MGGSQSWLSCDATYPESDGAPYTAELESGDPIIAVFMLLGTLAGLLLLTVIIHCGVIACRACRSRHRKRRHRKTTQHQFGAASAGSTVGHSNPSVLVTVEHASTGASSFAAATDVDGDEVVDEGDEDGDESDSSSMATSSDTSIDSTTARIAARLAAQRRRSRFLELRVGSPALSAAASVASASPAPGGGSPVAGAVRGGFDNPAFNN
ncbi:hypothetical protein BOX15_Mlig025670g1 [Macrostomum lignano]|uniref:Uncharacterized protein n=1 Tax=Macrostomum lignano TaxID=282301 RepID=A0A267GML5_9PLAT|nr:hypothetical protein BOX15_Mlig025670g1 [Macrostomum lignano]